MWVFPQLVKLLDSIRLGWLLHTWPLKFVIGSRLVPVHEALRVRLLNTGSLHFMKPSLDMRHPAENEGKKPKRESFGNLDDPSYRPLAVSMYFSSYV